MSHALELPLYGEALIRLFFPSYCGTCSKLLEIQEQHLCESCNGLLYTQHFSIQDQLLEDPPSGLSEVWSLFPYEGLVKKIIGEIKFANKRWLLSPLIQMLSEAALRLHALKSYHFVVPIPLERSKRVEREFHSVQILARKIAQRCQIPCLENGLVKYRRTLSQNELSREERLVNIQNSLKAKPHPLMPQARILLIDDVYTTGATTGEAARALKKSGAREVDLLTLARTERKKG